MKVLNEDGLRKDGLGVLIHPVKDGVILRSIDNIKNKTNTDMSSSTSKTMTTRNITISNSSSNNELIALQILVIGTKCDSIVCIDSLGSTRINLGNYGSALRVLGAEVTFITGMIYI